MTEPARKPWFRRYEWDVLAGIMAAAAALVLHLLHIVEPDILLAIALVLLALLLLRQIRREEREERVDLTMARIERQVRKVEEGLVLPEVVLIGPRQLRPASEAFARQAHGRMIWFNVCLLMFRPQELFDCLLKPAVENPRVNRIEFVLDEGERSNWRSHVMPKLAACQGRDKVLEPRWCAMKESVSFVLADRESGGHAEAQLSFWGEPFMARATGRDIPRYIFHVHAHSDLIPRLVELERSYRMRA
jgi:hypothetical protein